MFEINHKLWVGAHTFYNHYKNKPETSSKNLCEDYSWRKRLLNSPNGDLLVKNSLFNDLNNSSKIYLAHVTYSVKDIIESGYVYPSGGCLVGSVYCLPVTKCRDGLRMHNLGSYIYNKEAPMTSNKNNIKPDVLLFEIDNTLSPKKLIGIDYLKLGNNHYNIYRSLEYLLSIKERNNLHEIILKKIKNSTNFLSLSNYYYHNNNQKVDCVKFLDLYIETIDNLPILGYLYFEVVSEYIMLFQDNKEATRFHKLGEFYNPSYKDLMFNLFPDLSKNFKLDFFKPKFEMICHYIKENGLFKNFDEMQMLKYICERLIFLSNVRLFNNNETLINFDHLNWGFDEISPIIHPLVGQIIHRELRTFNRYPDFYFYFDQLKALQVWNYWNYMDVVTPFNGVIPKGEIGINPASTKLEYKVFLCDVYNENNNLFLKKKGLVDVKIAAKLIDFKLSFMRKQNKNCLK